MIIDEEVRLYISSKETNGALLLTGKWGSGKTYLIREISKKINQERDNAVIIVSLFGLESTEELNHKVKEAIFQLRVNKDISASTKERVAQIKNFISSFSEISKITKGINAVLSVNLYDFVKIGNRVKCNYRNELVDKNLILVFDDFERLNLDLMRLIGVINDYVENKAIKTILIADEEKIDQDNYKMLKEKLISRTIKMKPNYAVIIREIISNYHETAYGYSEFLNKNYRVIEQVFYESGKENIRSLKTMIIDFERVYERWTKVEIGKENMAAVLYTYGAILFEHRSGNYKKDKYGYLLDDIKLKEKYLRFSENNSRLSSLQKWITTGEWDDKDFADEIKNKYAVRRLPEYSRFLLSDIWGLDNKILSKGFKMALDKAYEGELTCDELISLLQRIHFMNKYQINQQLEPNYKEMQKGLDKRQRNVKEKRNTFIMEHTLAEMDDKAVLFYREIDKFSERFGAWENRLNFINYMDSVGAPYYDMKGKCIVSFDDELLESYLKQYRLSGNSKRRELSLSLRNLCFTDKQVSGDDDIRVSKENFSKLKSELERMVKDEVDMISKVITNEQIKIVNEIVSGIENTES